MAISRKVAGKRSFLTLSHPDREFSDDEIARCRAKFNLWTDLVLNRAALTPAVWKLMAEPFVPKFAQLWFERDVAAVITESPIGPDRVDDYLSFLHKLVTLMGR